MHIPVVRAGVPTLVPAVDALWRRRWWVRIARIPRHTRPSKRRVVHRVVQLLATVRPCRREDRRDHTRRDAVSIQPLDRQSDARLLHIVQLAPSVLGQFGLVVLKERLHRWIPRLDLLAEPRVELPVELGDQRVGHRVLRWRGRWVGRVREAHVEQLPRGVGQYEPKIVRLLGVASERTALSRLLVARDHVDHCADDERVVGNMCVIMMLGRWRAPQASTIIPKVISSLA